jgi:hypothetical protein
LLIGAEAYLGRRQVPFTRPARRAPEQNPA